MDSHSRPIKLGRKQALGYPKNLWSKKLLCECGSNFNRKIYHKIKMEQHIVIFVITRKVNPRIDLKIYVI